MMGLTALEIAKIAFTGAIQATGGAASTAGIDKAKELWAAIRQKFQGNEYVEEALNDVESQKSSEILEQQIVPMLQRAMNKDPQFAQKLQNIAKEINQEINSNTGTQKNISMGNITGENANVVNISGDNGTFDLSRGKTEKK